MTSLAVTASSTNEPAHLKATIRAGDPTVLTRTELDAVAGGGGGAGINPSRNGLRLPERA